MDRYYEIGRTLEEHCIRRLCHMTQIDKLFSILYEDEGIFATAFCNSKSMYRNDKDRLDGKNEYISTSIEKYKITYPDLYLSKELFSTRMSDSIRNGCRPREIVREKGRRTQVLVRCA